MAARTLDIPEKQALVCYDNDPNGLFWHHRILFNRVEGSVWIIGTPDRAVYSTDLGEQALRPLRRDAGFPADVAGQVYCFGALTAAQLNEMRAEAREMAELLGAAKQPGGGPDPDAEFVWALADPAHKDFGKEFGDDELTDPNDTVMLDEAKGVHRYNGDLVFIESVERESLDEWRATKRPGIPGGGAGDVRLLGNFQNKKQQRQLTLARALELVSEAKFSDWPFRGPRATHEFLLGVLETGGDVMGYFNTYIKRCGISERSAVYHELKCLFDIIRLALSYDQLDVTNLAAVEQAVRRVVQIQMAIRRNPKHPSFDGLDSVMSTIIDDSGAIALRGFNEWLSEEQSRDGKMLRSQRRNC